jgi:hypothetical protein
MATIKKKRFTPQQRQEYVEQFGRSGLSQAEFCRQAKLHPMTFSLWRRKPKAPAPVFAQVEISAPVHAADAGSRASVPGVAAVLHLLDGAKLEVALEGETAWAGLGVLLKTFQSSRP